MASEGDACPNCGHPLGDFRIIRTSTGSREVVLHWLICSGCGHVCLGQWSVRELVTDGPATA